MSKTQIHSCFNNIIIDMCVLRLFWCSAAVWIYQSEQGFFFWAIWLVNSFDFIWFPAISSGVESKQKWPQWSPTFQRSLIPCPSLNIFEIDDLCCTRQTFDVLFGENSRIFMKSIEWDRGSSFIVFSIHWHRSKRLHKLILSIFRNHDSSECVVLISLMICVLNGHSEHYRWCQRLPWF